MFDIGIGVSLAGNSLVAAEEALRQAWQHLNNRDKVDLAIIFHSLDLSPAGIAKVLQTYLEGIPVAGASGNAVLCSKGVLKHGLVIALISFPEGIYCSSASAAIRDRTPSAAGKDLSEKLLYGFKNIQRNFALLLFDRLSDEGASFIAGLQETLGKSFPCIGASASSRTAPSKAVLYSNSDVLTESCTGILWGGKINFGLGIKHGWKPLGKPHTVTSAAGAVINTIDGVAAVKLYEDYLACDTARLKQELKKLSVAYPIGVRIPGEEEYLLRNIISIDDSGALLCQGVVPEGATVRLMISTQETCLEATRAAIETAQKRLANPGVNPHKDNLSRFAIVFSSFSRYNLLRRHAAKELQIIKESLGPIPLLGLYTHGELAPLTATSYRGQTYFHNQDFSVLLVEG